MFKKIIAIPFCLLMSLTTSAGVMRAWHDSQVHIVKASGGQSNHASEIAEDIFDLCKYAKEKNINYIFIAKYGSLDSRNFFQAASRSFKENSEVCKARIIFITRKEDENSARVFNEELKIFRDENPYIGQRLSWKICSLKDVFLGLYYDLSIYKKHSIIFIPCQGMIFDAIKDSVENEGKNSSLINRYCGFIKNNINNDSPRVTFEEK